MKTEKAPHSDTWQWKAAPAYKNERLAYYQRQLLKKGITNREHQKLLVAQLIQEAGSLSETTIGDGGCSFGILQYNACVHHGMSAKNFLAKPQWKEWNDWRYQLDRMADMVAERYELYDGNIKLVVTHHNCPACAISPSDPKWGPIGRKYYGDVSKRLGLLTTL